MSAHVVRAALPGDAAGIAAVYNHYVLHDHATFETEPVAAADMAARLRAVADAGLPWLVADAAGAIAGYAYATPWRARAAYRRSVEISVYVAPATTGRGFGRALYQHLLEDLRSWGAHAVIGGIALPNAASVALHERLGFVQVASFREVGHKFGRWIDVGYWQRLLD
jgi:phosphinothricin acetyltransferase